MKRLLLLLAFVLAVSAIHAQSDMTAQDLMSGDSRSLYEVLGVSRKANTFQCMKKYNKYLKKNHPSRFSEDPDKILEVRKVVFAYCVLSNLKMRELYDKEGLSALNDKVMVPSGILPVYEKNFYHLCFRTKKYPVQEIKAKHEGSVKISYVLSSDGTVSNPEVVESSGFEALDQEALRTVLAAGKKASGHITPAYSLISGKPVDMGQEVSVHFYLRNEGYNGTRFYSKNYKDYYKDDPVGANKRSAAGYVDGYVDSYYHWSRQAQDRPSQPGMTDPYGNIRRSNSTSDGR